MKEVIHKNKVHFVDHRGVIFTTDGKETNYKVNRRGTIEQRHECFRRFKGLCIG